MATAWPAGAGQEVEPLAGEEPVAAGVGVRHVVLADLPAVVGQAVRVGVGGREQQQADVLVDVGGEDHDPGRLLLQRAVLVEVLDAGDLALIVAEDLHHPAVGPDLELAGLLGVPDRGDEGARLGVVPAAEAGCSSRSRCTPAGRRSPRWRSPPAAGRGGSRGWPCPSAPARRSPVERSGGIGNSRARGDSKGLPPSIIWPLMLPACPETPIRYSTWS